MLTDCRETMQELIYLSNFVIQYGSEITEKKCTNGKKKKVTHQFTILMQNNGRNLFSYLGNLEMLAIFGGSS